MNRLIEAGVIGLVVAAPWAFGAVEPWAVAVIQMTTALLLLCWAVESASKKKSPSWTGSPAWSFRWSAWQA